MQVVREYTRIAAARAGHPTPVDAPKSGAVRPATAKREEAEPVSADPDPAVYIPEDDNQDADAGAP